MDATKGEFVQNLDYDSKHGRMYGFGADPATDKRSLTYVDTKVRESPSNSEVCVTFSLICICVCVVFTTRHTNSRPLPTSLRNSAWKLETW